MVGKEKEEENKYLEGESYEFCLTKEHWVIIFFFSVITL